ncbi:MAG TPA: ABC transporter ATP-binding protein [Thermoanaerobaculia bacterium]|nr:ABC transporter ATP-binding protein [Thermoanaerobaculia bacterium]
MLHSTILEARDLSKSFAGPPLFTALSFRVEKGLFAVTGRNGSGKTTLIKILASLLRPGAGTVRIERAGKELSGDERRLAVGWAGPDLAFYDDLSAVENLVFFRKAAGWRVDATELERRLADSGLDPLSARRRVGGYSTGMKQRLRIAFALLFDPPVLLLDEPALGLDAEGRAAVEGVIAGRRREAVVVVASNDPRDFAQPDQVIELGRNR